MNMKRLFPVRLPAGIGIVRSALAIGCLGLLDFSLTEFPGPCVSDKEAAEVVGGQSDQCGHSGSTSSTGCNVSPSSWKPWDACTSAPFVSCSGASGQNVYVSTSCYSGCGNYCGSVTTNYVCGSNSSGSGS
jgi:hypothetical protein